MQKRYKPIGMSQSECPTDSGIIWAKVQEELSKPVSVTPHKTKTVHCPFCGKTLRVRTDMARWQCENYNCFKFQTPVSAEELPAKRKSE